MDAALLLIAIGVEDGLRSSKVELVQVLLDSLAPDSALLTLRLLFGLALLQHIVVAIVILLQNLWLIIVIEVQLRQIEVISVDNDVGNVVSIELLEVNLVLDD